MRTSDAILANDLREAGLEHLAVRAEASEWNDYFGAHEMPQHALIHVLKEEIRLASPVRKRLIANVVAGKYDGTKEESQEWARSPEGRSVMNEFLPKGMR